MLNHEHEKVLVVRVFLIRRKELDEVLTSNNTTVDYSLFYRVFILTAADTMFTIPLGILVIIINSVQVSITPYQSWAEIHYDFSRVDAYTFEQIAAIDGPWATFSLYWSQWVNVLCALILFLVYGTSMDFVRFYWNGLWRVFGWMGFRRSGGGVSQNNKQTTIRFASFAIDESNSHSIRASQYVALSFLFS